MENMRCERGKVFFSPHDAPGTIYFLKEGRVRLYRRTPQGKQLTVAVLDRGAVFGESRMIGVLRRVRDMRGELDSLTVPVRVTKRRSTLSSVSHLM